MGFVDNDGFEMCGRPPFKSRHMQRLYGADNHCVRKVRVTASLFAGGHNSCGALQLVDCLVQKLVAMREK